MKKSKHKYQISFACEIQCLHHKDKDRFLAQASLENIKNFIPKNIDFNRNEDLIAFAGNGTIVNRANKNGHLIDAETAVDIHDLFKFKFLNIDHNRDHIVGVITDTGFSSYDKNTVLASSEVKDSLDPFYLTIGGVVYKNANEGFAEKLEESSDPESKLYRKISLSWEVAFSSYYILVGDKNISEGEVIKDPEKIEEYSKFLDFNGGKNRLEDGTPIYAVIFGEDVLPLGFGFTLSPAAEVEGVLLNETDIQNDEEEEVEANNTSLSAENNVKTHNTSYINMDIKSLEEFKNKWNEIRAAETAPDLDFVFKKLQEASEQYSKDIKAKEEEISSTKQKIEDLQNKVAELETSLETANSSLASLEAEKKVQEQDRKFQERMNVLDEEYELDDETSSIVASKIKELSDEDFSVWKKEFDVLAREKSKAYIAKAKEESEKAKTVAVKAQEDTEEKEAAEKALAQAKEKDGQALPNASATSDSVKQKWAKALEEGFEISK